MSAYVQGLQNANDAFEAFADGQIHAGTIASGTGAGTVTTATLGFTPDFVVFSVDTASAAEQFWSTTSTTLTITGRSTSTAGTISYIAGNLA